MVPIRETQVSMEPSGTVGTTPVSSSPRSGFTTIMVTTKTMAIMVTQMDRSFSRDFTASPMLMSTSTQQPNASSGSSHRCQTGKPFPFFIKKRKMGI